MWTLIIELVLSDPSAPRCPLRMSVEAPADNCMLPGPRVVERRIEGLANQKLCLWESQRWYLIEPDHNRTADASELRDLPHLRPGQQWLPISAQCEADAVS